SSGAVLLDGREIARFDPASVRSRIARSSRINEQYEHLAAGYRLLAAMGTLRQSLPADVNDGVKPLPAPSQDLVKPATEPQENSMSVETLDEATELLWQESSSATQELFRASP
ncbi:MAG: hypothetical protein HQL95_15660, partial [Magnetococcales bacterium]|nr:hypothetical protein [Magnetococcales bacterium]